MTLARHEVEQLVMEYQQGGVAFDEIFKKFEKLIHDCFWKFLKKLTPSQIGSSAATAACAQGRIILRDVLREHRAPRLQSKHECRAE